MSEELDKYFDPPPYNSMAGEKISTSAYAILIDKLVDELHEAWIKLENTEPAQKINGLTRAEDKSRKYEALLDILIEELCLSPQDLDNANEECKKIIQHKKKKYLEHAREIINKINEKKKRKIIL